MTTKDIGKTNDMRDTLRISYSKDISGTYNTKLLNIQYIAYQAKSTPRQLMEFLSHNLHCHTKDDILCGDKYNLIQLDNLIESYIKDIILCRCGHYKLSQNICSKCGYLRDDDFTNGVVIQTVDIYKNNGMVTTISRRTHIYDNPENEF